MRSHLVLRLHAPLIAFGGEAIDNLGVIRDFPALSMVTGLIANALGWDRSQGAEHNRLQERLRMGCVLEPGAQRVQDFQTAQLGKDDKAWTTWGQPEERAGGAGTYAGPHLRYRDYHADLRAWVVLALQPADEMPTLQEIATALDQPARPCSSDANPACPQDGSLQAGRLLPTSTALCKPWWQHTALLPTKHLGMPNGRMEKAASPATGFWISATNATGSAAFMVAGDLCAKPHCNPSQPRHDNHTHAVFAAHPTRRTPACGLGGASPPPLPACRQ